MIRALLFDLDETLTVHESAYVESYALVGALAEERAGVDGAELARSAPRVVEDVWQGSGGAEFTNRAGFGGRDVLWAGPGEENDDLRALQPIVDEFRVVAWHELLSEQGVENERLVRTISERFPVEMWKRIRAFDDVLGALISASSDYELVLVSNGMPSVQDEKLCRAGLAEFFDKRVVSGAIGEGKPSRKMFAAALDLAGVEPNEALMFGDVPERDIQGARALGIHSVWVNRAVAPLPEGAPKADREVADLMGLRELIRGL